MDKSTLMVLCTCPDQESCERIAKHLVEHRIAACVTISSPVKSVYRWQGELETADEYLLLIKTTDSRYEELEEAILSTLPYELPEVVAVPVVKGLQNYLGWITQCTNE